MPPVRSVTITQDGNGDDAVLTVVTSTELGTLVVNRTDIPTVVLNGTPASIDAWLDTFLATKVKGIAGGKFAGLTLLNIRIHCISKSPWRFLIGCSDTASPLLDSWWQ